jgi:hypothetical protein
MAKAQKIAATITIDGTDYALSDLSEAARAQLQNIRFCDQQILQLQSEWAVADTARIGYTAALKRELEQA